MACKFCNVHGELEKDRDYIWKDMFDFGMLGDLEFDSYISCCNKKKVPVIDIQAILTGKGGESIDLGVKRIRINFCPFCGRDLSVEETPLMLKNIHKIADLKAAGEIATITANSLQRCGVMYLEDLGHLTKDQVKRFRRLGEKSLFYLEKLMENYDISFSEKDEVSSIMVALDKASNKNTDVYFDFTSMDGKTHSVLGKVCLFLNSRSRFSCRIDSIDPESGNYLNPRGILEIITIRNIRSSL